jgi:two-component system OmpR family response regulator
MHQRMTTAATPPTNILLVDDDAELSLMLSEFLADEGFALTVSGNGQDGAELGLSGRFAAVILDVMLPRIDGVEVLRRIRQASDVPVIMLTARGDNIDRVVGLELGADDYIAKPYYPRELVARLRAVLRRSREKRPTSTLARGELVVDVARRETTWQDQPIELTATEFTLLEMLMRTGADVASKEDLSLNVLGRARQAYDRSVDVHISNLRRKLDSATSGAIGIETVRGVGFRLRWAS